MLASEMALAIIEVQRNRAGHNTLQTMKYELIVYVEKLSEFGAIGFESCTDTVDGQEYQFYKREVDTEKDQAGEVIVALRGIPADCFVNDVELRFPGGYILIRECGCYFTPEFADTEDMIPLLIEAMMLAAGLDYDVMELRKAVNNLVNMLVAD